MDYQIQIEGLRVNIEGQIEVELPKLDIKTSLTPDEVSGLINAYTTLLTKAFGGAK